MHVRISEEPETNHVTTWQDFLRDNRSLPLDLLREIRSALERWRDFHLGGGAAPHVTLTRAEWDERR